MAGINGPAIGSISVTGSDGAIQDGVSTAIKATVFDYTNSNPIAVRLTDTDGSYASLSTASLALESGGNLATIAGAVSGTEMQADVLTLPAITIAAAQTLATVTTVGAVTSISNALPAGTNNIGDVDVATIAAGDNNIGNVDIVSLPAGNLGMQLMTASLSVVPASNITDATYIGDIKFGEALPAGTALLGKVSIDQVTANANEVVTKTGSVTNATLSAETTKVIGTVNIAAAQTIAVTNAGTFATQVDGAALTALQLIDDPVSTDDGAASVGRKIFMVGALADDTSPDSVDEGDGGMLRMSLRRELYTQIRDAAGNERGLNIGASGEIANKALPPDIDVTAHTNYARKYYTSAGAATDGVVWSPAAGKRWHVVSMYIQTSAAATITLEDDKAAGDDPVWKGEFAANEGMTINFSEKYPLASGEDAADLLVTTSAGNIYITCTGYEI